MTDKLPLSNQRPRMRKQDLSNSQNRRSLLDQLNFEIDKQRSPFKMDLDLRKTRDSGLKRLGIRSSRVSADTM